MKTETSTGNSERRWAPTTTACASYVRVASATTDRGSVVLGHQRRRHLLLIGRGAHERLKRRHAAADVSIKFLGEQFASEKPEAYPPGTAMVRRS